MTLYVQGMRHGYRIVAGLIGITLVSCLAGCHQGMTNDKDLIQQRLQQMVRAVENRQVAIFLEAVHSDFVGQGTLRKANLAGMLLLHFRQHQSITARLSRIEIQLDKDRATVILKADLGGQGGWLGQGRHLSIESRWQKVADEWQVERARWRTIN